MNVIALRRAHDGDRPAILAISRQIWDGEDYVPHVLDRWMGDPRGELVVALTPDGAIRGFARVSLLSPRDGWIEGVRVDPDYRRRGVGRALLRHCVDRAASMGVESVRLATHAGNLGSTELFESAGFKRRLSFTYMSLRLDGSSVSGSGVGVGVRPLSPRETFDRLRGSLFLRLTGGFVPIAWAFRSFDTWLMKDLEEALSGAGARGRDGPDTVALGSEDADGRGGPAGLCLLTRRAHEPGSAFLCLLEGGEAAAGLVLREALTYAGRRGSRRIEYMCPDGHPSYGVARAAGLEPLPGFDGPDVFLYELA